MSPWLEAAVLGANTRLLQCAETHPARQYLHGRGVTLEDIVHYRLGYWSEPPQLAACTKEFWDWVCRYGYERVVFPLTDPLGHAVGMQVRHLGNKGYENFIPHPRELNLPIFGLHEALPAIYASERAVLVEGVFDYFAVRRVAPDVLCTLTANVSNAVKRLVARYATMAICLFDMDATGRRAAYRLAGLPVPPEYQKPDDAARRVPPPPPFQVLLPPYSEHDPDDLRKAGKLSELQRLVHPAPLLSPQTVMQ